MSIKHDYKSAKTWKQERKHIRRHGLLVITLILIGLFGSLLAYMGMNKSLVASGDPQPPAKQDQAASQPKPATNKPAKPSPKPATLPEPQKPKYDFYTELPKRQVIITKSELKARQQQGQPPMLPPLLMPKEKPNEEAAKDASPPPESVAKTTPPKTTKPKAAKRYIVQAGSFRNYADADRVKASLALLGIRAHIEKAITKGSGTLNRVRIGPLKDAKQADALRRRLRNNNIQAITIKID